jgi:ribosome-binding factor A
MPRKPRDRSRDPEATSSWRDEDFDSDEPFRDTKRRVRARRTAQVCASAERALRLAIDCELDDERLDGLTLAEVRPLPDAGHLLVLAMAPDGIDPRAAEQALLRAGGRLRLLVGRTLSRKRVPLLSFAVLPEGAFDER